MHVPVVLACFCVYLYVLSVESLKFVEANFRGLLINFTPTKGNIILKPQFINSGRILIRV